MAQEHKTTILLVDDDEMIVEVLQRQFIREGYAVEVAFDGAEALSKAHATAPDLILLDVMMPRLHGWDVVRTLRQQSAVPILMLTARGEEMDRVLGLELGADDYIVKPFSFRELLARVRATLRRISLDQAAPVQSTPPDAALVSLGHLSIDRRRRQVTRAGQPQALTQREYDLLIALLDARGAVASRSELLDRVWGESWFGDARTLDVHIRWLREKLERDPSRPALILTVRGVGYRLVSPDEMQRHD